jgi:L-alanine-DL-glutamate epimerase-like enolase superfamily enzyme
MVSADSGPRLKVSIERWPIRGEFRIARGAKQEAAVVVATICAGGFKGRGESVPYPRYGESVEGVAEAIEACADRIAVAGFDRTALQAVLPPGAARNALDCALWDLEAKRSGKRAFELAGLAPPRPVATAFTISLDRPAAMAAKAAEAAKRYTLLKLKLGGEDDAGRIALVRAAAPHARLIIDANEAWCPEALEPLMEAAAAARVELIEQPLPAGEDWRLGTIPAKVAICADESVHDKDSIAAIADCYDAVNIKLDKTGGLTEALAAAKEARRLELKVMVGCMVGTSLALAPALLVAQGADWVDLDGPLLLERDRVPSLTYADADVLPAPPELWG